MWCAAVQDGETALYCAAEKNHTAVMQCLLDNNVDTELPNEVQYKDIFVLCMPDCVCVCVCVHVAVTVHPHIVLQCIVNSMYVSLCLCVCVSLCVCATVV